LVASISSGANGPGSWARTVNRRSALMGGFYPGTVAQRKVGQVNFGQLKRCL
jgi:hypothetical protein